MKGRAAHAEHPRGVVYATFIVRERAADGLCLVDDGRSARRGRLLLGGRPPLLEVRGQVFELDPATDRLLWSDNFEKSHSLPAGSLGNSFAGYQANIHPDDRARVIAAAQKYGARGVGVDIDPDLVDRIEPDPSLVDRLGLRARRFVPFAGASSDPDGAGVSASMSGSTDPAFVDDKNVVQRRDISMGKLLGICLLGLTQLAIWLGTVTVILRNGRTIYFWTVPVKDKRPKL